MKKIGLILVMIIMTGCFVMGCKNDKEDKADKVEKDNGVKTERFITDLSGAKVKLPPGNKIKRVVIVAPPVVSMAVEAVPDKKIIVGLNDKAFLFANKTIINKIFPEYRNVETKFIGPDFAINKEALLALKPDVILYYGEMQKKNLGDIGVPAVNFFSPKLTDAENVTVAWHKLLCDVFDVKKQDLMSKEWKYFDRMTEKMTADIKGKRVRALWVFSNHNGKLIVAGKSAADAYAEGYFKKAGIENVANEIKGTAEVSMEQVQAWNPDIIFVFHGLPAKAFLDNQIQGQDWSMINAFKNKKIYDIPRTTYSWATPCSDSPIMPLWLISKAYPDKCSKVKMETELKKYYKRVYNISLDDKTLKEVMGGAANK